MAGFLARQAGHMGLRKELLDRAHRAIGHLLYDDDDEGSPGRSRLTFEASYDELRLTLVVRRTSLGPVLVSPGQPRPSERILRLDVPGADLATMQRTPISMCLRLEFDA